MADRMIKLASTKLPDGDANGLADREVVRELMEHPDRIRVGIVIFKVTKVETDTETGDAVGKIGIRRVELLLDDSQGDATALERLLSRAYERRTGTPTLHTELEADVRAAFDHLTIDDE